MKNLTNHLKALQSPPYLLYCILLLSPPAIAEETPAPDSAYDCTVVQIDNIDESTLTKTERIALMEQALLDSIDQYDSCIDTVISKNAATGGGGRGEDGGESDEGKGENESEGKSEGENNQETGGEGNEDNQSAENNHTESGTSGAKNEEIDPKDNDAAVCIMLKDELKIETDPEKKRELKEIYTDYNCRN